MFESDGEQYAYCEVCDKPIRTLVDSEVNRIAKNPYNYMMTCSKECRIMHAAQGLRTLGYDPDSALAEARALVEDEIANPW